MKVTVMKALKPASRLSFFFSGFLVVSIEMKLTMKIITIITTGKSTAILSFTRKEIFW